MVELKNYRWRLSLGFLVICILVWYANLNTGAVPNNRPSSPNAVIIQHYEYDTYSMWRQYFINQGVSQINLNKDCGFIYYTTFGTISSTTHQAIKEKNCGEIDIDNKITLQHSTSADLDVLKKSEVSSQHFSMIFVRDPVDRFVALYNTFIAVKLTPDFSDDGIAEDAVSNETKIEKFAEFVTLYNKTVFTNEYDSLPQSTQLKVIKQYQPLHLSMCVRARGTLQCFVPESLFVGRYEKMECALQSFGESIRKTGQGGNDDVADVLVESKPQQPDSDFAIDLEVVMHQVEARESLLMICKLFWNDFTCFNYRIPKHCVKENKRSWHLPLYCIDVTNNQHMRINYDSTHFC